MLFLRRHFSQWMQLWHFKLVRMIAHGRFEGNLRLQVPGKVVGESGRSIFLHVSELNPLPAVKTFTWTGAERHAWRNKYWRFRGLIVYRRNHRNGAWLLQRTLNAHLLVTCLLSLRHCFRNSCTCVQKWIPPYSRFNSVHISPWETYSGDIVLNTLSNPIRPPPPFNLSDYCLLTRHCYLNLMSNEDIFITQ